MKKVFRRIISTVVALMMFLGIFEGFSIKSNAAGSGDPFAGSEWVVYELTDYRRSGYRHIGDTYPEGTLSEESMRLVFHPNDGKVTFHSEVYSDVEGMTQNYSYTVNGSGSITLEIEGFDDSVLYYNVDDTIDVFYWYIWRLERVCQNKYLGTEWVLDYVSNGDFDIRYDQATIGGETFDVNEEAARISFALDDHKLNILTKWAAINCLVHDVSYSCNGYNISSPDWLRVRSADSIYFGMDGYWFFFKKKVATPSNDALLDERYAQINNAKPGDTVTLEMGGWDSLQQYFMKVMAERRDVTFIIHFTYKYEDHDHYEVVIPAGKSFVVEEDIMWFGPLKLNAMFGMKAID